MIKFRSLIKKKTRCSIENKPVDKPNVHNTWRFLVVDGACYKYHKRKGVKINENLAYVENIYHKVDTNLQDLCCKCIASNFNRDEFLIICESFSIPKTIKDNVITYYAFKPTRFFGTYSSEIERE